MVQPGSLLTITDSTGVMLLNCIKILGLRHGTVARPGRVVAGSVRLRVRKPGYRRLRPGSIQYALLVRSGLWSIGARGFGVRGLGSAGVLVTKGRHLPLASRIRGPVSFELRFLGYYRVFLISTRVY